MTGPNAFRFLGVEREIVTAADWNHRGWPKLWLYNAHYFDDLVADEATERATWHQEILARWIAENPPSLGNGWEPYPTSLRVVNWLKWLCSGQTPPPGMLDSLAIQVRWLRQRLEHHLLGNHLWANAKALVFAGCLFEGDEADAWLRDGMHLLRRELREQILADGGHFERSAMYHALFLEDLLDLAQLGQRCPERIAVADRGAWHAAATRMLRWLRVMTHPDGGIAFFNDAALDVAPTLASLEGYASTIAVRWDASPLGVIERLDASGFMRLQMGEAVLIADVGDVGPSYLPGHAHAGTLSFELAIGGERLLVNSGISTYALGALRAWQRGTAAHNTVVVDGQDSSETWASFRVARRARVLAVTCESNATGVRLQATHDGYRRLAGKVVHARVWQLTAHGLSIEDRLDGGFRSAEARFHVAPGRLVAWHAEGGTGQLQAGQWYPRFGGAEDNTVLVVRPSGRHWTTHFHWSE